MNKSKRWIGVATAMALVMFHLSPAIRVLADDGPTPEETPVVTPTEEAVPSETPEPAATEEAAPAETAADPTEETAPEETPAPDAEETAAPETEATPTEETAPSETPDPQDTPSPDPEGTPTPDSEETADPDPEEDAAAESDCVPPTEEEIAAAEAAGEEPPPACEAEEIEEVTVSYSDPMWCPTGQVPGDSGCTPSFATITELIDFLIANSATYYGDGAIYFQAGDYTGPEEYVVIDYSVVPQLGTLEVLGGWDLDPDGGYSGNTGETTFTVPVIVVWDEDVTIADVAVDLSASPTSDSGLSVFTEGDVTLENVQVTGGGNGAVVDAGGDVTVRGDPGVPGDASEFNDNTNTGLLIYSSGTVTLTDVVANGNRTGIFIDNSDGAGSVNLTNVFASDNGWTGVDVRSAGDITLDGVTADNNIVGANLEAAGAGNVFVGDSSFTGNTSKGIQAVTYEGNIVLDNVQVDCLDAPGSIGAWLKTRSGGTITVLGGVFTNAETGLFIVGTGEVVLEGVAASGNLGDGAKVQSGWVFACIPPDGIPVTVDGGTYQDNGGYGFVVYPGPNGTVTLAGTIAYGGNGAGDNDIDLTRTCVPYVEKPAKPYQVVEISGLGDDPVTPDCEHYSGVMMILPDQSRIKVACPAEGEITVTKTEEQDLPAAPPQGVVLVDGYTVATDPDGLLAQGGSMQMCFKIPPGGEGQHYAILYWDESANNGQGAWIELPIAQFNGPPFPLHPDTPEDGMLILVGVQQCGDCVCVTVTFSGTFILVAR
ncbi:MAG: right-handed parallel beta-helix repeat-containing protein [Anaerolineales bacterium]|nr:right-handed parallel beta-helix repeat-containing protein [Anaerolineales bacterium]